MLTISGNDWSSNPIQSDDNVINVVLQIFILNERVWNDFLSQNKWNGKKKTFSRKLSELCFKILQFVKNFVVLWTPTMKKCS